MATYRSNPLLVPSGRDVTASDVNRAQINVDDQMRRLGAPPRFATATINFGAATSSVEANMASVVVAAPWVVVDSIVHCRPWTGSQDHPDPEDALLDELQFTIGNVVPGVSFELFGYAPNGTWGRYNVACEGLA